VFLQLYVSTPRGHDQAGYKKRCVDRGSPVGTATRYGMDVPGIESRWGGRDFPQPSKPAVGPTQFPMQWVPALSRGVKWPERGVDHPPPSSAEVKD